MKTVIGDIWAISTKQDIIVIPTNIGWKHSGRAVMGKGLARDAARRWPDLPWRWGEACWAGRAHTPPTLFPIGPSPWCTGVICYPTKPLNAQEPWKSWMSDASYELIEYWLPALNTMAVSLPRESGSQILVPTLGCGCGGLHAPLMAKMMNKHLSHERFVHVYLR